MNYEQKGIGQPLILLHGAFVNSSLWQHQMAELSKSYRVIAFDLRGHGNTGPSTLGQYSVEIFADDVLTELQQMGIERFYVAGLSLGAMVAQRMAHCAPRRVLGLVLVGATVSLRLGWLEKLATAVLFPRWLAMILFDRLSTKQFMKLSFLLTWFIRGNRWLGAPATRSAIRKAIAQIERNELKKIYAAVHDFRKQNLGKGDFQVLLVCGEFDSRVVHRHNRYLLKHLGQRAELFIIEGGGHACNFDSPFAFNALVQRWIDQQESSLGKDYSAEYTKWPESHRAN